MKTLLKLMAFAAALALVSCAKELPSGKNENTSVMKEYTLDVSMPQTPMLKTVMGGKNGSNYPVYWQTGDIISINGYQSSAVQEKDNGKDVTSFTIQLPEDIASPFNLIYPGVEGVTDQVILKSEQNYVEGTFDTNTLPMYATANNLASGFDMNYLAAVVQIPLKFTLATEIVSIELKALGGEALSGNFVLGKDENGAFDGSLQASEDASTAISLLFDENEKAFAAETGCFHFVIPAGRYSGGIQMTIVDKNGGYMKAYLFAGEDDEVVAGKVYEYVERAYVPDGTIFYIYTPEDLVKLGKQTTIAEIYLMTDLDMTGVEYNSNDFNLYGTFEGNDHAITGLTQPLFNNIYGVVRNLSITADVDYDNVGEGAQTASNNPYGIGLLAHYAYNEMYADNTEAQIIENVTVNGSLTVDFATSQTNYNIGGLVGANNGVHFKNCVNNATVTLGENFSGKNLRMGGVAGAAQSSKTARFTSCRNSGAIIMSAGEVSETVQMGGLAGYVSQAITFEDCENTGAVIADKAFSDGEINYPGLRMGGLFGYATTNVYAPHAKNSGAITFNTSVTNAFVGGVAGLVDGKDGDISYAENTGDVTVSGSFAGMWVAGVLGSTGKINADYIKNTAPITAKNAEIRTQIWIAGCIGRLDSGEDKTEFTIQGMQNSGAITIKEGITSGSSSWQYIAGVLGSGDSSNKILKDCHNTGNVDGRPSSKQPLKVRMGGLAGIINRNPEGSSSKADVKFYGTKGSCEIGGLVGYLNVSTYKDLTFKGTVYTNGTSGTNYVGGIVGNVNSGSRTFENCAVYGTIHGANGATGAGVFYNAKSATTATFTSCKVGVGTHRKASGDGTSSEDYKFDMTTQITADLAKAAFAIRSTEATVTDCTVVDPSTF